MGVLFNTRVFKKNHFLEVILNSQALAGCSTRPARFVLWRLFGVLLWRERCTTAFNGNTLVGICTLITHLQGINCDFALELRMFCALDSSRRYSSSGFDEHKAQTIEKEKE